MFLLKKLYFTKKIYPSFYQNIDDARKEESAILFLDVIDEVLTIMVIIDCKAVVFKKRIDSPMMIENIHFNSEIDEPTNDVYELITKLKNNASKVKNHGFIETFSEMINKVRILYKLYGEQQHNIWNEVFSLDPKFFVNAGEISLPIGSSNKWID